MSQHELLTTLKTLQTQLSGAGEIDEPTQKMLQNVTRDIQSLLAGTTSANDADNSLTERVRATLIEFEVRHPHLGGLLERITDGLASIGI